MHFPHTLYVDSVPLAVLLVVILNLPLEKRKVVATYDFEKNDLVDDPLALSGDGNSPRHRRNRGITVAYT
jgi:hypothetical protein